MKKLVALLILITTFFGSSSIAQSTLCNAQFSTFYQNGNTVQFNPVVTIGPPNVQHYWYFGDGQASTNVAPSHTFTGGSVFTVVHTVNVYTNGALVCADSVFMTLQVQNSCNLTASFYSFNDSTITNGLTWHFENTTVPLHSTDSIRWTFGDGTSSGQVSLNHTYTQPGNYNACLRVQQRDSNGILLPCVSEICHSIVVQNPGTTCTLQANFYAYLDTTVSTPNSFHFQNTSVPLGNTDSIRWTFGDGTESYQVSPNHTYAQPGTYTVCLRVQKRNANGTLSDCIRETCHTIVVQNHTPCTLVANYYAYLDTTASTPLTYHFENTSVPLNNTDSVRWTFGDGTASNQVSPNHTYTHSGTYTVCLRVQKRSPNGPLTDCIREICHSITILNQDSCTLVASFYSVHDTLNAGPLPNIYHFVNTSTPLNAMDSVHWTFGDGSGSSELNPTHSYAQAGTYAVCLRVQKRNTNGIGYSNCISETCHTIVIPPACNVQAHFIWIADSLNNRKIYFSNQTSASSTSATALWSFGDGTSSTTWNPVHEYAQPGNYAVCLRVQVGPNCVGYWCDSITIQPPVTVNCMQQSQFSFVKAAANSQLYYFTPTYTNTNWQYTWTFGDGTGSHAIAPTHHYTQAGNYTACLTVYRDANCASTTCKYIHVVQQVNCDSVHVGFNYQSTTTFPNRVYFSTTSNYSVIHETWTITRIPSSSTTQTVTLNQYNPIYVFTDTGYYNVCLRAETSFGCIKEVCRVIHIAQLAPVYTCNLQLFPNPANNQVSANIFLTQPQMIDVYIYNSMNILVKQKHQQGSTGNNVVTVGINDLVPGNYTMKVIHGNDVCYAQFVKL